MKQTVVSAAVAMCLLFSCTKATDPDMHSIEKQAFTDWIEKYVKGAGIEVVEQENGMYVEFITDGPQTGDGAVSSSDKEVWVMLDYTATDHEGNVFMTCDRDEALRQGSFTPHTHYVPDYLFCSGENFNMIDGQHFALKNQLTKADGSKVKLTKSSKVRLYIPSYLALGTDGSSNNQGYGGQYPLGGSQIVIETLEVVDVIENPVEREENLVKARAAEWGKADDETVATLLYMDENFIQTDKLLEEFPEKPRETDGNVEFIDGYDLTVDSIARIRYIGRFLDGFVFDTNIQSVYDETYDSDPRYPADDKTCEVLYYKPATAKDQYISAFYHAIPEMRRGKWYRIVFTSAYAYGATGMSKALKDQNEYYNSYSNAYYQYMYESNSPYGSEYYNNYYTPYDYTSIYGEVSDDKIVTEIQPYTPLVFEIYIETE
jgi:FKBP-type peptidyl-prolyl cis-trans isomerase